MQALFAAETLQIGQVNGHVSEEISLPSTDHGVCKVFAQRSLNVQVHCNVDSTWNVEIVVACAIMDIVVVIIPSAASYR